MNFLTYICIIIKHVTVVRKYRLRSRGKRWPKLNSSPAKACFGLFRVDLAMYLEIIISITFMVLRVLTSISSQQCGFSISHLFDVSEIDRTIVTSERVADRFPNLSVKYGHSAFKFEPQGTALEYLLYR